MAGPAAVQSRAIQDSSRVNFALIPIEVGQVRRCPDLPKIDVVLTFPGGAAINHRDTKLFQDFPLLGGFGYLRFDFRSQLLEHSGILTSFHPGNGNCAGGGFYRLV